jgi:hypothetical protein
LVPLIDDDSIEKERFASSVLPSDRDDSDLLFDTLKENLGLL